MSKNLYLGIELGSTRIKSVLIGQTHEPVAIGNHNWENRLVNGIWTYSLEDIWQGLQASYSALAADYEKKHNEKLTQVSGIGISAMMHGYIPLDAKGQLLTEFRTWRNTNTEAASKVLTPLFNHNIPLRWCIAHLYQAILNGEEHVCEIATITTLAGYIHYKLTGQNVLGVGDASGAFPIDSKTCDYHKGNVEAFDALVSENGYAWKLAAILPKVLPAGYDAGQLSLEGAKLLDPSGNLTPGAPFCAPEGDAGTGMVATNSVAPGTGNVSAGTSIFAMLVLEEELSKLYPAIDMVTTPDGKPVAMVHCNNGTSDLNAWVQLFHEAISAVTNTSPQIEDVYKSLYQSALTGDADGGGLTAVNYLSGEHNTGFEEGRPLFVRLPDARFTLANFMRTHLFAAMATLKLGMDILAEEEKVKLTKLMGHGGLFATKGVAQKLMAGALNIPVAVTETANEGGAWGIAILAAYTAGQTGISLAEYLNKYVFVSLPEVIVEPDHHDTAGFETFMERFAAGLKIERAAVDNYKM